MLSSMHRIVPFVIYGSMGDVFTITIIDIYIYMHVLILYMIYMFISYMINTTDLVCMFSGQEKCFV